MIGVMGVINRYFFKNLLIAFVFVTIALTMAVLMTQLLRFLELVVEAGAPTSQFLILMGLTIPRLLDIIIPISLFACVLFVYNKMMQDSEIVVLRAAGISPRALARPALILSLLTSFYLIINSGWLAPMAYTKLQEQRSFIQTEFSSFVLREGVFNSFGERITVYIQRKDASGHLYGLLIHQVPEDSNERPSTIIAEKGIITGDALNPQVIVFNGVRHQRDLDTGQINRLNFESYRIDVSARQNVDRTARWQEPSERTMSELWQGPRAEDSRDISNAHLIRAEIHKRISAAFLTVSYVCLALAFLFAGNFDRRGQSKRILAAVSAAVLLQVLLLGLYNIQQGYLVGTIAVYAASIFPALFCWFFILGDGGYYMSQKLRQALQNLFSVRGRA